MATSAENNHEVKEVPAETTWAFKAAEVARRCKAAGIRCESEEDEFSNAYRIEMPCGRTTRRVYVVDDSARSTLLDTQFEKYSFLGDYEALSCPCEDTAGHFMLEASIQSADNDTGFISKLQIPQILTSEQSEIRKNRLRTVDLIPSDSTLPLISIGPRTAAFKGLCSWWIPSATIKIKGKMSGHHDEAVSILERLSDAVFFQIEGLFGSALSLSRYRPPKYVVSRNEAKPEDLKYPSTEYDAEPMALYLYAKSARGLPLVQFLAFYQTLEYYYPHCVNTDARRRIRTTLKDPAFRPDRERDIARILEAVQGGTTGHIGERSMLQKTVQECVAPADLNRFIKEKPEREKFFSEKRKELTAHPLTITDPDSDLRHEVANRIYDIRCRIVHTKGGEQPPGYSLLLPNSKEAGMLTHDIELVHFLARNALISQSSLLKPIP